MANRTEDRKHRHRADTAVKQAQRALVLSRELLAHGHVTSAARATQLAERQAKLAERLIALDASLKRIAEAKRAAELHFTQRSIDLNKREAAITERERRLPAEPAWMNELLEAKEDPKRNGGW